MKVSSLQCRWYRCRYTLYFACPIVQISVRRKLILRDVAFGSPFVLVLLQGDKTEQCCEKDAET